MSTEKGKLNKKERIIVLMLFVLAFLIGCQTPKPECSNSKCDELENSSSPPTNLMEIDKCENVSCNDSCLNNTLFYGGTCEQGRCVYNQTDCPNGCATGKCLEKIDPNLVYALVNGGFELGDLNWSVRHGYALDTSVCHFGSISMKSFDTYHDSNEDPTTGDARAMWTSYKNVKEGQIVFAHAYMMTEKANCSFGLRIGLDFQTSDSKILHSVNGEFVPWGNNWTYREVNGVARAGDYKVVLWLQTKPHNCPANAWFDDIEFKITQS